LSPYVATLGAYAVACDAEAVIERALADLRSAHNGDAALAAFRAAQNSIAAISLEEKTVQPVHIDDILPAVVDR
jgi:replicative DNA helicase